MQKIALSALTLLLSFFHLSAQPLQDTYDVVIYGATSAGISAAIQSSRLNKTVLLIEPSNRIGGLTTGGLGATDIGSKIAVGGISREFYENIKKHYDDPQNWKWQNKETYSESRTSKGEEAMWTFEPSAALKVYKQMMHNERIDLVYDERLLRDGGVKKKGASIESIQMESGKIFHGRCLLMPRTKATSCLYRRELHDRQESNKTYGETLNGVQANR